MIEYTVMLTTFYALRNDKHNLEYIRYTTNFEKIYQQHNALKRVNEHRVNSPLNTYGGIQEWDMVVIKTELSDTFNSRVEVAVLKRQRKSISSAEYTKKQKQKEQADVYYAERQAHKEKRDRQRRESEEFRKKCLSDKAERELHSYNPQSYYLLGDDSSTHHPTEQKT